MANKLFNRWDAFLKKNYRIRLIDNADVDGSYSEQVVVRGQTFTTSGQLHTVLMGIVDDGNSSVAPLGIGGVFTGVASNTLDYGYIYITVFSDVASTTDGLSAQLSSDGINWDNTDVFTIPAGTGKTFSIQPGAKWFRIVYTNGAVGQTAFRLQAIYKKTAAKPSSHRVQDTLSDDDDGELTLTVPKLRTAQDSYVSGSATNAGNYKVSAEESDPDFWKDYFGEVSLGNITGRKTVNKFGHAPDGIQTTETDIWDRADAGTTQSVWLAPTAARIHTIASTSAEDDTGQDGVNSVIISYLADWDTAETTETVTGNINAGIAMDNAAVMIHRMKVVPQASTLAGVNVGTITATAAGDATITAAILPGNGQTEMAIYGIPSTQSALVYIWMGQIDKVQGAAASADFLLRVNPNPDVQTVAFLRKNDLSVQSTGTSSNQRDKKPPICVPGPAIIKVTATASAADIDGEAGFDLIVADN